METTESTNNIRLCIVFLKIFPEDSDESEFHYETFIYPLYLERQRFYIVL